MNGIIISVILVAGVGLILGLGLAVASAVFAVPVDEKEVAVRECLPGANCGACGFSGCDGYAGALAKGETTECNRCTPGGNDVAAAIAEVMGLEAGSVTPIVGSVMCQGYCGYVEKSLNTRALSHVKWLLSFSAGPKTAYMAVSASVTV